MKPHNRRRGQIGVTIGAVMVATMMAGSVQPAAANPAVAITDAQWGTALFGAGVRLKSSGVDLDKDAIASAELLDWRAKNPTADARTMRMHLGSVRSAFSSQLTPEQAERPHAEVLRRLTSITYTTPGVVVTGSHVTDLFAMVTGRDLSQAMKTVEQRLTGIQQGMNLDANFTRFSTSVWTGVRNRAATDAVFATVWNEQIGGALPGQPFGLDSTAPLNTLKALPGLQGVVDLDALKATEAAGKQAFIAEAMRQAAPLIERNNTNNDKLVDALKKADTNNPAPGASSPPPDQSKIDRSKKDMADRQKYLDTGKGAADFIAGALKYVDAGAGAKFSMFVETTYKLATQANKLINALEILGAATSIGAAFGGIGAVVGAAVGLIQIFSGLLGGGADRAAQQQVMDAMTNGFANVQKTLQGIYHTMNKRFDRIDTSLDQIYYRMQVQFNQLLVLILDIQANVKEVHDQLLTLQTQLTSFNKAVLAGMSNAEKVEFLVAAGTYVDYSVSNNGRPLPDENSMYIPVASRFMVMGTDVARDTTFTQDGSNSDAGSVLRTKGPSGAVDWLATYANSNYQTTFAGSLTERVPNVDLWAQAARAYYLLASQSPQFARNEGAAQYRASQLISAGEEIQAHTRQFGAPDQTAPDKINKLFKGLHQDYKASLGAFTGEALSLADDPEVMYPRRQFDLWDPYKPLTGEQVDQLAKAPESSLPCVGNGPSTRTHFVNGHHGNAKYLAGMWIEPNWSVQSCYQDAELKRSPTTEQCNAPYNTKCNYHFVYEMKISYIGSLAGMPGGPIRTQTSMGVKYFNPCNWTGPKGTPQPAQCSHSDTTVPSLDYALNSLRPVTLKQQAPGYPEPSFDAVGNLVSERRAQYYQHVAQTVLANGLNSVKSLNNKTMLYQAYTDLGLPRAKLNDDQLHALLYGSHGLIADTPGMPGAESPNLILSAIYYEAAEKQRAGGITGPLKLDQLTDGNVGEQPIDCASFRSTTGDGVGACLKKVGEERADRLHHRVGLHFRAMADNTETQSLPLVDEAVDSLTLAKLYARAGQ